MVLTNSSKYISKHIMTSIFKSSQTTYVDKVVTGNGMTTAFLKLDVQPKTYNFIIVPNISIAKDKESIYRRGRKRFGYIYNSDTQMHFIYGGSRDSVRNIKYNKREGQTIVIVVDSFLNNLRYFINNNILINTKKIMVDEAHTIITQGTFRDSLLRFKYRLEDLQLKFKFDVAYITASPLLQDDSFNVNNPYYFKINNIHPSYNNYKTLNINTDLEDSVNRASSHILKGDNVLIMSNSIDYLSKVLELSGNPVVDLHLGSNLMRGMADRFVLKLYKGVKGNAQVNVHSSSAFEGIDIISEDTHIFIYMNRRREEGKFHMANVYQALGRARKGFKYAELAIKEMDEDKLNQGHDWRNAISELKLRNARDKYHTNFDKEFKQRYILGDKDNYVNIINDREDSQLDVSEIDSYKDYFDERKIQFNYLNTIPMIKLSNITKKDDNVYVQNKNYILNNDLLDGLTLPNFYKNTITKMREKSIKDIEWYASRFSLLGLPGFDTNMRDIITVLQDDKLYYKLRDDMIDLYKKKKESQIKNYDLLDPTLRNIYEKSGVMKKAKVLARNTLLEAVIVFESRVDYNLIQLLRTFAMIKKSDIDNKTILYREYNIYTTLGMSILVPMAAKFNILLKEIDISRAFVRILYTLNELELPDDIYGVNKHKKIDINAALNKVFIRGWYDMTSDELSIKKYNKKKTLIKEGLDPKVAAFLVDNFSMKQRDSVFNFLTKHEKDVIDQLREYIQTFTVKAFPFEAFVRRHDSILLLNPTDEMVNFNLSKFVVQLEHNDVKYKGHKFF